VPCFNGACAAMEYFRAAKPAAIALWENRGLEAAITRHTEAPTARLGNVPGGDVARGMLSSSGATIGDRQEDRRKMTLVQRSSQSHIRPVGPVLQSVFAGFPESTLLESGQIPIAEIAALALREGQSTNPLYRVHRWFARRLGSQFRAILTGLTLKPQEANQFWNVYLDDVSLEGAITLDPFVGGGTSLVEAARCGARVIGYDIDPVATFITRFELEATSHDTKTHRIGEICSPVSRQIAPFHLTTVPGIGERVVLHHFWVECRTCSECGTKFELHPHYQLAYSEAKALQWVFCKECHAVSELPIDRKSNRCECGVHTRIGQGALSQGKIQCPACKSASVLGDRGDAVARPEWRLFAQEYLEDTAEGVTRHFKKATTGDRIRYGKARRLLRDIEVADGTFGPDRPIPTNGRSDRRPLIHGFTKYRDLFNDRQLLHLNLLGQAIVHAEEPQLRRLLAMAFSEHLTTNCMYTAYAFGYRRVSPMFSIHSYRHITRPVEINPWLDGIGRGTFPNVVGKIAKAVAFAKAPTELDPKGGRRLSTTSGKHPVCKVSSDPWTVLSGSSRASIATKSSEHLDRIQDGTVDLILTDPPYFDNLSYSELSDFYLAWHQSLGVAEPPYDNPGLSAPLEENLASPDRADESFVTYQKRLRCILSECHRVLKKAGVLVFTYHHKSAAAWGALGQALVCSGLRCTALLPMRGEGQGGLHSYDGTIKWDAVFVCRKGTSIRPRPLEEAVVSREAIELARLRAAAYAEHLKTPRIGFREPDRVNLERAMIVASAQLGQETVELLSLKDAIRLTREHGGRQRAKAR
jgi:putative DNA methylase